MKPQIIIPASLLILCLFLCGNNSFAARKGQKEIKTEKADFKTKSLNPDQSEKDHSMVPQKNNNPARPKQKENQKDSIPQNEAHKKTHSEEDGKHHHFHMHRAKRAKRFSNLICFLAKFLLILTHICLLVAVFQASFAH